MTARYVLDTLVYDSESVDEAIFAFRDRCRVRIVRRSELACAVEITPFENVSLGEVVGEFLNDTLCRSVSRRLVSGDMSAL